jgi:hypothetical protein
MTNSAEDSTENSDADEQLRHIEDESVIISETIVKTANGLLSIDTLQEIPREESIEEARIILRWLRNMEFADRDLEEFLDNGTPAVVLSKKQNLQKLVQIFALQLRHKQSLNQALLADAAIRNARDAVGAIALEIAEHTRNLIPDGSPEEIKLNALIDSLPESTKMRQNQSVEQLIDTIELGLTRATQKIVERSPFERLSAMSAQLAATTKQLQSLDAMQEPAREESVELAREILRRLKNLSFSERPLEEFIQTGKPEDKAAFAQQMGEMAEMYKNLLNEAAQSNPDILTNETVRNATETINTFLHSVKLMAAKEMPSSLASTQRISAEAAENPAEWGNMHKQAIDRLLKAAEEAMEKAIEEISRQQEEQQAQDQGIDDAEEAIQHSDQAKRKKKRRKGDSKPRSGKGGGGKKSRKQQHQDNPITDYVLKQGRFNEDIKIAKANSELAPLPGLKASDMELIKQLGGSLRDFNNQGATIVNVAAGDKIAPDDKTVSQRVLEREQQQTQNPKGQGPRV